MLDGVLYSCNRMYISYVYGSLVLFHLDPRRTGVSARVLRLDSRVSTLVRRVGGLLFSPAVQLSPPCAVRGGPGPGLTCILCVGTLLLASLPAADMLPPLGSPLLAAAAAGAARSTSSACLLVSRISEMSSLYI